MDTLLRPTAPEGVRPIVRDRPDLERIELKQLEHVIEVCDAGSFSGAARRLRLSQPALSKSISRLEVQLGVRLFERTGGAARATDLGRLIAERGRSLLLSSNSLSRELEQRVGSATGRLRIAMGPTTRLRPLPQVVKGVLARFPDLKLETTLDGGRAIMRGVDQGRYDVAFGHSENAERYGELIRVKIYEDETIVVARPDHPAAGAEPLSASELLEFPMASSGITDSFRAWVGELSEREAFNAEAYVSDDVVMMQQCLPSQYTLRGARFAFERALAAGELVELPLQWKSMYHCWMLTTAENWRLPVVKAVAEMARGCAAPTLGD
jgi:DNA-binding transcriptional LysR family regulator